MLLLNAITLFSPDRSNLKNTEVIRAKQLEYYQLLRTFVDVYLCSYLNFLCSPMEAHQAYDMLLGKLSPAEILLIRNRMFCSQYLIYIDSVQVCLSFTPRAP
uniref:NR LBD domain-containing protein n=1 Tax=Parascaris equorum TaxID=6256 RepID=A0A914RKP3_PAREQ